MQGHMSQPIFPTAPVAEEAGSGCPRTLQIVGRAKTRENADLCGEYVHAGVHAGRAAYRKRGAATAIRYSPRCRRWVIDRSGLRDSDICVAYADACVNSQHPAHAELVWHIWDSRAQAHLPDAEVAALDAPGTLSLVGRAVGRENHAAVGEYELQAVHHGRAAYRQRNGDAVIRFHAPEGRWLLSAAGAVGNVCSAFAEGAGAIHPGCPELVWQFWENQRNAFLPDPATKTLTCPTLLHIVGRAAHAENARICGTYHLAGAHDGRPLYVQPGSQKIIRYSAKSNRWLIDCDGLAEPSLLSRLYQWILNGDSSSASDQCSAFADALTTPHPGFCALEWQVWETRLGRHNFDPCVRATTAPLAVQVRGRDPSRENADITGEYMLAGTHSGHPAYLQSGTRTALRYWPPMSRWVVDRDGLRSSAHAVAYVDDRGDAEHPAQSGLWHVFESSRGCHLADPSVTVAIPTDAPTTLQAAVAPTAPAVPMADGACGAHKRLLGSPGPADVKRLRPDYYPGGAQLYGASRFAPCGA